MRKTVRVLTVSPDNESLWVRLYVHQVEDYWAAMLVGNDVPHATPTP